MTQPSLVKNLHHTRTPPGDPQQVSLTLRSPFSMEGPGAELKGHEGSLIFGKGHFHLLAKNCQTHFQAVSIFLTEYFACGAVTKPRGRTHRDLAENIKKLKKWMSVNRTWFFTFLKNSRNSLFILFFRVFGTT